MNTFSSNQIFYNSCKILKKKILLSLKVDFLNRLQYLSSKTALKKKPGRLKSKDNI